MAIRFIGSRLPGSGSLIGNTVIFRHMEMGDSNFSIDEQSVIVNMPVGIVTPAVTVTPSGPTNTYVLQAIVNEATGGLYDVIWTFVADGQTIMRREKYLALYNDLYDETRRLLRVDSDNVADVDIDSAGMQVLNNFFGYGQLGAMLGTYNNVPMVDVDKFDRAIALMTAAFIRPFTPKQEAVGDVTKWMSGTDQMSWSAPDRSQHPVTIEERWINQASELLAGTTCLGPTIASIQDVSVAFRANGRRRRQNSPLVIDGMGGLHINPLFTMWANWLGIGADFGWSWMDGRGLLS